MIVIETGCSCSLNQIVFVLKSAALKMQYHFYLKSLPYFILLVFLWLNYVNIYFCLIFLQDISQRIWKEQQENPEYSNINYLVRTNSKKYVYHQILFYFVINV